MTETSYWWDGHTTGDAANAPYEMARWVTVTKYMLTPDPDYQGVIGGILDSLEVIENSAASVSIGSGAGVVNGRIFYSDAPITFSVSGNSSYWLVGLVMDASKQTVRAFARGGYSSNTTAMASLIRLTEFWEIPLAVVATSTSGTVSSIRDYRKFVLRAQKNSDFVQVFACWNVTDAVDITSGDERGFPMEDSHIISCFGSMLTPNYYWKALTSKAIIIPATTGNLYSRSYIEYGPIHKASEYWNQYASATGYEVSAVVASYATAVNTTPAVDTLRSGIGTVSDLLSLTFTRDSLSTPGGALDTLSATVYCAGWIVEYMVLY